MFTRLCSRGLCAAVVLGGTLAHAAEPPTSLSMREAARPGSPQPSPFSISLPVDLSLTAAGLASNLLPALLGSAPANSALLRAESVNGMDRSVIGNWSPGADTASTVLMATSIALPILAGLIDTAASRPPDGYRGFLKDALVLLETYALTSLVTNVVKVSVSRPRPYVFDPAHAASADSDSGHSFFSGHTAAAFSMATSYSYLFTLRHPGSKLIVPVWIGTHALAAATGFLRVEAGRHFWSDVLIGAAVGSSIGLLVPYLHTRGNFFSRLLFGSGEPGGTRLTPTVSRGVGGALTGGGLSVSGTF